LFRLILFTCWCKFYYKYIFTFSSLQLNYQSSWPMWTLKRIHQPACNRNYSTFSSTNSILHINCIFLSLEKINTEIQLKLKWKRKSLVPTTGLIFIVIGFISDIYFIRNIFYQWIKLINKRYSSHSSNYQKAKSFLSSLLPLTKESS